MTNRNLCSCFLFVFLLFLSTSLPVQAAPSWVLAYDGVNKHYIDADDINLEQQMVTFVQKTEFTDPQQHFGVATFVSQNQADFRNFKYRKLNATYTFADGSAQKEENPKSEWESIIRFSIISREIGLALEQYLSRQTWTPIRPTAAIFNPQLENDYLIYWVKSTYPGFGSLYYLHKCSPAKRTLEVLAYAGKDGIDMSMAPKGERPYEPGSQIDIEANTVLAILQGNR